MNEQNNNDINSQKQVQANENSQPIVTAEIKPKKKRSGLFTLFACIMTAIIVVLAMNIGQQLSKGVEKKSSKENTEEKTSNKTENGNTDNKVKELSNEEKATMMYKMAALFGDSSFKYKGVEKGLLSPHCSNCGEIFDKIMSNKELTEEEKAIHIIGAADAKPDFVDLLEDVKTDNQEIINSYKRNAEISEEKNWNKMDVYEVSTSEFDELYYSIYGKKPSKYASIDACPTVYLYDKSQSRYLIMSTYGGCSISLVNNLVYVDGMEATDDNTIVVYAYVGHSHSDFSGNAEYYNSYESDKSAKKIKEYETINEQNKNDFKKFKFTFVKSENSYAYKNVAEVQ